MNPDKTIHVVSAERRALYRVSPLIDPYRFLGPSNRCGLPRCHGQFLDLLSRDLWRPCSMTDTYRGLDSKIAARDGQGSALPL